MDARGFPELVWLDIEGVLIHAGVLSQSQLVLIREQADRLTLALPTTTPSWNHGTSPSTTLPLVIIRGSSRWRLE